MRVDYINPFINSVHKLFATMLHAEVQPGQLSIAKSGGAPHDVTALIGLSGPARGTVVLSFPTKTALNMVNSLLEIEAQEINRTVTDGVGELVNIVAGSAKTDCFEEESEPLNLSLPTVVRGKNFIVVFPSNAVWLDVAFDSELGPFNLRVIFE